MYWGWYEVSIDQKHTAHTEQCASSSIGFFFITPINIFQKVPPVPGSFNKTQLDVKPINPESERQQTPHTRLQVNIGPGGIVIPPHIKLK